MTNQSRNETQKRSLDDLALDVELRVKQEVPGDRWREWVSANATADDELVIRDAETNSCIGIFDGEQLHHVEDPNPYGSRFVADCDHCGIRSDFARRGATLVEDGVLLAGECIQCDQPGVTKIDG